MAPWLAETVQLNPLAGLVLVGVTAPGSLLMQFAGDAGPLGEARILALLAVGLFAALLNWWREALEANASAFTVRWWFCATAVYWLALGAVGVEAVIAFSGYPFTPMPPDLFQQFAVVVLALLRLPLVLGLMALLYVLVMVLVTWRAHARPPADRAPLTVSR